jgi:hypothetical protein
MKQVKIFFEDEAPRIGSGWRLVTAKIGRKWVRLYGPQGRRARFTLDQYARLKPIEQEQAND